MRNIVNCFRIAGLMFGMAACTMLAPVGAIAQTSPSVTLNFTGTYTATTCAVSSNDLTVTLPILSTRSLSSAGKTAGATVFNISMQCPSGVTGARVYFESGGATDPTTGNLNPQAVGGSASATNVQVMLANADGTPIKAGDRSTMQVIPITSTAPTSANFIASYYATGQATAGVVNTFVTYVVEMP
jgi:major type 1 subunit fimbrin (pilin)